MTVEPVPESEARLRALAETGSLALPTVPTAPRSLSVTGAAPPGPAEPSTLGLVKFRDELPQPPVIDARQLPEDRPLPICARPVRTQLHADLPETVVWAYEGSIPGPTIVVGSGREVRVDWGNDLVTTMHAERAALPYDVVRVPPQPGGVGATVRLANLPGGRMEAHESHGHDDPENAYPMLPGTDAIRSATVVHLHGSLTDGHNDGWAHNVALPGRWTRCSYPNEQESATLWYHDHAMAVTRFSVYAGLAGFYLIRDDVEDALCLLSGDRELVLAIRDVNLETEPGGSDSFAPTGRALYKQAGIGEGDAATEIPVTGPYTLVNGKIWPTNRAQPCWQRLRLLNASNARILRLALYDTTEENIPAGSAPLPARTDGGFGDDPTAFGMHRLPDALVVIGTDAGLLPAPATAPGGAVNLGPGERMDVLVNLASLAGRTLELRNENATVLRPQPGQADATALQIRVGDTPVRDSFTLPAKLSPNQRWTLRPDNRIVVGPDPHHDVIAPEQQIWLVVAPPGTEGGGHPQLWEMADISDLPPHQVGAHDVIRLAGGPGQSPLVLRAAAKLFDDTVTIMIAEGAWIRWNVIHLGGPAHPMHIHMTSFQMIERRAWALGQGGNVPGFDPATGSTPSPLPVPGPGPAIDPVTGGTKDTWVVQPGEVVSVLGRFGGATGEFMYHCHILDHEDHTMMRPFVVLPRDILAMHGGHGGGGHDGGHHG
ncbi:multicopper oxidase family protein [Acidipropionibacterium virtanenii]|uniref:O-aminophenol oxidase n=1 Tax=Acidipropionibacterium virtanenii TaxID=2057246 RepID=A0A344UT74_9ACTN|nr:multicopper oxidase domain-containing protein [Acidipropionibacterium virtanenii]AXE38472.1 O-aminophenol oxidase [Acidipropionibacterium virtanenii]